MVSERQMLPLPPAPELFGRRTVRFFRFVLEVPLIGHGRAFGERIAGLAGPATAVTV